MKKKALLTIICVIILIIATVIFVFQPTYLHFDMTCMEMTKDGTHLEEGTLLFTGLMYWNPLTGCKYLIPLDCQIPGYPGYAPYSKDPKGVSTMVPGNIVGFIYQTVVNDLPKITSCDIVFHDDRSCCIVYIDDRIFAGSATGDYDAAWELFDSVLYIGD